MLKASGGASGDSEIDQTNELFSRLSLSFDSKFYKHKHITARPKLKRLIKAKPTASYNNTAFCSRCKKETSLGNFEQTSCTEKEVDVKKDNSYQKKVKFNGDPSGHCWNYNEEKKKVPEPEVTHEGQVNNEPSLSESIPVHFQSTAFTKRSSIIGNNEFWLPQSFSSNQLNLSGDSEGNINPISTRPDVVAETLGLGDTGCRIEDIEGHTLSSGDRIKEDLTDFLNSIFEHTTATTKRKIKISYVDTLLDETLIALTDEHLFKCSHFEGSFKIIDAIPLRTVQQILVTDTEFCSLIILEIHHASCLTEFKEFVPGYFEKTESLISLMVYALSRVTNFLHDVIRIPFLSMPTCKTIQSWLLNQEENVSFVGVVNVENVCQDLSEESCMMRIGDLNQFHPVTLFLREGSVTSVCKGGCVEGKCFYSASIELTQGVSVIRREDHPWPNCIRLISEFLDVSLAGSSKSAANDLLEKLYIYTKPMAHSKSLKCHAYVIVTEYSLQLFELTQEKNPFFGSPLMNLDISDNRSDALSCIIESQGGEADDAEIVQLQNRWHLTFLNQSDKSRFLQITTNSDL